MAVAHTIGEVARELGLPTSTLRYYERAGLLRPAGRTSGNYRIYDTETVERLRFIRAAQATGFTVADIKALLEFRDGETAPCSEVRSLIESRLADVEQRMLQYSHVQQVLEAFLRVCRKAERDARCHVIEELSLSAASPSRKSPGRRKRTSGP